MTEPAPAGRALSVQATIEKEQALAKTRVRPDRGLTVRMGLTMLLLAVLYVVLVLAISQLTGALWAGILIGLGALWAQW